MLFIKCSDPDTSQVVSDSREIPKCPLSSGFYFPLGWHGQKRGQEIQAKCKNNEQEVREKIKSCVHKLTSDFQVQGKKTKIFIGKDSENAGSSQRK